MPKVLVFGLCLYRGLACRTHAAELVASIEFIEVHERIAPSRSFTQTKVQISAKITSTGQVKVAEDRASGPFSSSRNKAGTLGKADKAQLWKVLGDRRLAHYTAYANFTRVIYLTIDGSHCSIEVQYPLQPGQSDYRYRRLSTGENAIARSISASHSRCELKAS